MELQNRSLVGFFVWAKVDFTERDGRYKPRPALIIAQAKIGDEAIYLVAPKFSNIEKCRGDNEVVMSIQDAVAVGIDKEGVVRFNREHLESMTEEKIIKVLRPYSALPELKQKSLQNAARRAGFKI